MDRVHNYEGWKETTALCGTVFLAGWVVT
jgi:hypothetical protein